PRHGTGVRHRTAGGRRAVPARVVLRRRGRGDRLQPADRPLLRRARPTDPADVSRAPEAMLTQPPPIEGGAVHDVAPVARSTWQLFRRRFLRHKLGLVSIVVLVILMVACFGAPWLAPYKQGAQNILQSAQGPSAKHWFGTDDLGRDQLSEIMYAGRISL